MNEGLLKVCKSLQSVSFRTSFFVTSYKEFPTIDEELIAHLQSHLKLV